MANDSESWPEPFHLIAAATDRGERAVQAIRVWLYQNVIADDGVSRQGLPEPLASAVTDLYEAISDIRQARSEAFERFSANPLHRFLAGFDLSTEQYHLLAAMGVVYRTAIGLGLTPLTDYEVFSLLHYENEQLRCYINPDEQPRDRTSGRLGMRVGRPPEELPLNGLRAEQHAMFQQYLPDVYARFKRD